LSGQQSKRYRAVIFHPGPRTRWRTQRNFAKSDARELPVLIEGMDPDPEEIILERSFRTRLFAIGWVRAHLKSMTNVCAEIYRI
jgi:hypothetical protein